MTGRLREFQVPVVFDVQARNYDEAVERTGEALGEDVDAAPLDRDGVGVDSWWLLERDAKKYDGNDEPAGVVLMDDEADLAHKALRQVPSGQGSPHRFVQDYLDPAGPRRMTPPDADEQVHDRLRAVLAPAALQAALALGAGDAATAKRLLDEHFPTNGSVPRL